jgi:uncharacterized protein YukE
MKVSTKVRAAVAGVLVAILLVEAFDFFGGYDFIKAGFFHPTEEMQSIINELELTSRGERILKAANPTLDTREIFNEKCNSHSIEIYVLGCYLTAEDRIHLYDVTEKELDGVKEATAAHELLHAVYLRLPFWEKSSLNSKMKEYYDSLDDSSEIKESLKLYEESDFYDELHSRLGTEVKDLPSDLEKHFEAIFKNQDKIVDYYEKYSGTFKKYEAETEKLADKINKLQQEIDSEEKSLSERAANLNSRINNYNIRATNHNYTDVYAMRAEGDKLQNEANTINSDYDILNKKIDEYNKLIGEYNESIIRTNEIFNSINSNSEKIETVNN